MAADGEATMTENRPTQLVMQVEEKLRQRALSHGTQKMSDTPQIRAVEGAAARQPLPVAMARLLTAGDVASMTGLSVETLAQWRSQKRGIPFIKISRNCVRYRQSDLDSWLVERTVLTDQERSERR